MPLPRTASCPTCNVALADDDRFCKRCGTEVSGVNASIVSAAGSSWTSPDTGSLSANSPWELILTRLREVTLGEFDVGRELGRGGMAAVFLAHDLALNRRVAIKVMAPGLMLGDGMVQRFRQEAITIANLSHAHIVTIHAVRQLADLHFFVMQFVEGQSLETALRTHGTLPVHIVKAMLHQVGSALSYAHRRGVVHRDIKPGNILLSGDGDSLVTDFGIAKVAEGPTQTQTGMVVGTPTYMSPEQCFATEVDGASDQYSLGIVAYQMLTGRVPFTGSAFAIMKGHTTEPVPPIRESLPDVPAEVDSAILRMLAKSPSERFASFAEALAAMGAGPIGENAALRNELIRLAAVEERREQLGELLRTPSSPAPKSRPSRRSASPDATPITPRTPAPPPTAIAIAIAPLANALEVGDEVELRASVRGTSDDEELRWASETPDTASIDAERGVLTAIAAGDAVVVARLGGAEERLSFSVIAPRVTTIRVDVPTADVRVGDTHTLVAHPLDKSGATLERPLEWSVVGASAEIGQDGTVRLHDTGRAAVSVMCDGVYETIVLQVAPARVATIEIIPPGEALEVGHSVVLGARARDVRGSVLTDRAVRWTVSPGDRARVDAAGVLSALQAGEVRVTATAEDVSATLALVIPPARAVTVAITNVPEFIRDGDRFTLTVLARDVRGTSVTRTVQWRSSEPSVATVDRSGEVHAIAAGAADISVTVDGVSTSARLLVHATPEAFAAAQRGPSEHLAPASATEVLSALVQSDESASLKSEMAAAPPRPAPSPAIREEEGSAPAERIAVISDSAATVGPTRSRPAWAYAAAAVPILAIFLWLATRGGDASNSGGEAPSTASAPLPPSDAADPSGSVTSQLPENASRSFDSMSGAEPVEPAALPPEAPATAELRLDAPASSTLIPAQSLQLRASARDSRTGAAVNANIRFTSSDSRVARVDARTGEVTAVAPGRVTITADAGDAGRRTVPLRVLASATETVAQQPSVETPPVATPPVRSDATTNAPPTASAAAPVITRAQLEREARAAVDAYARAFESESLDRIRAVFPSIPPSFASGLSEFFGMANDVQVTINSFTPISPLNAEPGSRARVDVRVSIRYNDGRRSVTQSDTWPMTLQRDETRWRLTGVGEP